MTNLKTCYFVMYLLLAPLLAFSQHVVDELDINRRGVDVLRLESSFANVLIRQGDTPITHVEGRILGDATDRLYNFSSRIENKILTVALNSPLSVRNDMRAEISVVLPPHKTIEIVQSTGTVTVLSYRSDSVRIQAKSGAIVLERCTGRFNIINGGGAVSAKSCDGELVIEASGDISISNFSGGLELSSNSGDIYGRQIVLDRNCYFSSPNGDITFDLLQPEDFFSADVSTQDGNNLYWNDMKLPMDSFRKKHGKIYLNAVASGDLIFNFVESDTP